MTALSRSALLPFQAADLFALVDDIPAYPEFLPGCVAAEESERGSNHVIAALTVRRAGISQRFATRNTLFEPERIEMALVEGPFAHFTGIWCFEAIDALGCEVRLDLDFELKGGVLARPLAGFFEGMAGNLVDAFCQRAAVVLEPIS